MDWKQDVHVMDSFHQFATTQLETLNTFLNSLTSYNDGTPMFAFLQIYGVLINRYNEHAKEHTETDSLDLAIAEVANHPTVQSMVANMMQKQVDRGLGV